MNIFDRVTIDYETKEYNIDIIDDNEIHIIINNYFDFNFTFIMTNKNVFFCKRKTFTNEQLSIYSFIIKEIDKQCEEIKDIRQILNNNIINKFMQIIFDSFGKYENNCIFCKETTCKKIYNMPYYICKKSMCIFNISVLYSYNKGSGILNLLLDNEELMEFLLFQFIIAIRSETRLPEIIPNDITLDELNIMFQNFPKFDELFAGLRKEDGLKMLDGKIISFILWLYGEMKDKIIFKDNKEIEIKNPIFEERIKNNNFDNNAIFYHGSSSINIFNIINGGLKNYSNTKMMTVGAVYGSGIYLSSDKSMALHYAKNTGCYKLNSKYDNLSFVYECRIVNLPKYNKGRNIFVVPENNHVIIEKISIT